MYFCELLIAFVSIVCGIFIGVLLAGLTTSKEAEDIFNDAYKLGYEKDKQAEKEKVVAALEKQSYEIRLDGAIIDSCKRVIETDVAIDIVKRGGAA